MSPQSYAGRIYILATTPLLFGSGVFFYWLNARYTHASNVDIEILSAIAILTFILAALITLGLSLRFLTKHGEYWWMLIPSFLSLVITIPAIILYGEYHHNLERNTAFLRIINDKYPDVSQARVWSLHEDDANIKEKNAAFTFSYNPVYTYDYAHQDSFGPSYTINDVYLTLRLYHDQKTFILPSLEKGMCRTINLSELQV